MPGCSNAKAGRPSPPSAGLLWRARRAWSPCRFLQLSGRLHTASDRLVRDPTREYASISGFQPYGTVRAYLSIKRAAAVTWSRSSVALEQRMWGICSLSLPSSMQTRRHTPHQTGSCPCASATKGHAAISVTTDTRLRVSIFLNVSGPHLQQGVRAPPLTHGYQGRPRLSTAECATHATPVVPCRSGSG